MKYSDLISFNPIEDVIQLITANDKERAREYVKSYVMSDAMAENIKAPLIDQLQMDEVIDNKGVLVIGNYGTGKSHLMSVVSAVATDKDNLALLKNKKFAQEMEPIAGKFEVLRLEIGGVIQPLYNVITSHIQEDFEKRNIDYDFPAYEKVVDLKKVVKQMMEAFNNKYPEKGYLIVVDEFLSYLTSRNEIEIVRDLEFFRVLGEMCSKSRLRIIFGMQEKIFDNPKFSFVANTLQHVNDRFTQLIITKEDTAYVVSERILKKNAEQKAIIRAHLEKFAGLYTGMASNLEKYVELFPIHPAYIEVFNKIHVIENRHILKNISTTIKDLFDKELPTSEPGVISFDTYWPAIKGNGLLRTDETIKRVVEASQQLEEIINRAFPKATYKPLAKKIIYALSVHRLSTGSLDLEFGMTAENLKDDLALYTTMPEEDSEFLLGVVQATLRDIMATVSGQFIIQNAKNGQYYIDVNKTIDYDEKIKQKASILSEDELNHNFYNIIYSCLEWDAKEYVTNFRIYQYELNWDSHRVFREGYLFMGLPGQRSTAQPERDFYIHIMPPYTDNTSTGEEIEDEVYLYFKSKDEFHLQLGLYAAARSLAQISEGKDKNAYLGKANELRKELTKYLNTNKNTCFEIVYKGTKKQLLEVLKGRAGRDLTFKDTIDKAASICLDEYFSKKYPDYPMMETKITQSNLMENLRVAIGYFAGRKNQQAMQFLRSFGLLEGDKLQPEASKYAAYYIHKLKQLPPKGVINYTDIFENPAPQYSEVYVDKRFKLEYFFTPVIFLSLVYGGYAVITTKNNNSVTAANLDQILQVNIADLYEFKYLARPAQIAMAELKKLFEVLELNPVLLDNPNSQGKAVEMLLEKAKLEANNAVIASSKLDNNFNLWNEALIVNTTLLNKVQDACAAVRDEFSNYSAKFNTFAKLNNFSLSMEQIATLDEERKLIKIIYEYESFKNSCSENVNYVASLEFMDLGSELKVELEQAKAVFRNLRDEIYEGAEGELNGKKVNALLEAIKEKYIAKYYEEHKKKRLDIKGAQERGRLQESRILANLRKLRNISILSSTKLTEIENAIAALVVCCDLTTVELRNTPVCPHCHFKIDDKVKRVAGQLENLELRLEGLQQEWTKTLLDTISDPLIAEQKQYLSEEQEKKIDSFVKAGVLPEKVDDFFVKAIVTLLQGFEPVVIDSMDLVSRLEELPPMDSITFKDKVNELLEHYVAGKDLEKLRIVVKRTEGED